MAQSKRFILREERNFVEVVEGTLDIPSRLQNEFDFADDEDFEVAVGGTLARCDGWR